MTREIKFIKKYYSVNSKCLIGPFTLYSAVKGNVDVFTTAPERFD